VATGTTSDWPPGKVSVKLTVTRCGDTDTGDTDTGDIDTGLVRLGRIDGDARPCWPPERECADQSSSPDRVGLATSARRRSCRAPAPLVLDHPAKDF